MPPQVHQLPKHYLDMEDADHLPSGLPLSALPAGRLVVAMFCSYSFADKESAPPFMTFDVMTPTSFLRDLELH